MTGKFDAVARSSRWRLAFVAIFVGSLVGLALAEVWFRIVRPSPRRQMVRDMYCLRMLNGAPVWGCDDEEHRLRHNRECVEQYPERLRILFFGSSITYGSGLLAQEAFTTALQVRLNETRPQPGYCIMNFAEPGFSFEQKLAVARQEVPHFRPDLIMWEDWTEWHDYKMIGNTAYGVQDLRIRPDGYIGLAHVPDGLNRRLFDHSRLYEFLVLMYAEQEVPPPFDGPPEVYQATRFANGRLVQVPELARSVGAKLVFYLAPPLNRSFADLIADPPDWHIVLTEFAHRHATPVYTLQEELKEHDYLDVRQDDCCHYNAKGHVALVPVMERIILQQLDPAK